VEEAARATSAMGCDFDNGDSGAACIGAIAPVVLDVSITGDLIEGSVLNGAYTFDSDKTESSTYRWFRGTDLAEDFSEIGDAMANMYTLTNADVDNYLLFEVTPQESDCNTFGEAVMSEPTTVKVRALGAPYFTDVTFTGTLKRGETVTASATYNDDEADLEDTTATAYQSRALQSRPTNLFLITSTCT
jgi:hypothetical protein